MDKKEFFGEVYDKVKNISIFTVANAYGRETKRNGSTTNIRCTSHANAKLSHASLSTKYNCFRCHHCGGKALKPIEYIIQTEGLEFKDAVLDIALKTGLIESESFEEYYSSNNIKKPLKNHVIHELPKDSISKEEDNLIAEPQVLHNVFKTFIMSNWAIKKLILTDADINYLSSRGISKSDINRLKLFSIPDTSIMPHLLAKLKSDFGYDDNILDTIPGFFKNSKGEYTFKNYTGIGIPILNADELVVGIQIRLSKKITFNEDGKEKSLRYIWFSSSSIPENCTGGTGSGSPIDILYPSKDKTDWANDIFISEGKFKTNLISLYTNAISISVQGVGNWSTVPPTIETIITQKNISLNRVFICFDGDIAENYQVSNHALNLSNAIQDLNLNLEIFYCIWDDVLGKGIDDVIKNNNLEYVKFLDKPTYDAHLKEIMDSVDNYESIDKETKKALFIERILSKID